jgi:formate-dependent nitrite reductase membrane component NrfD
VKHIEWGFLIITYLFLGGLSAGAFFVSAVATLLQGDGDEPGYARVAKYGALLAPWPVMIGCTLLIFDLGRMFRFWKLFLHLRWTSPMSIGSWLLMVFILVTLSDLWAWLSAEQRAWISSRLPSRLGFLNPDLSNWRRQIALFGIPFSVGVGIYTGVLLGAVQSRPFWNTNLVAQLFLFSALSSGCAAVTLLVAWRRDTNSPRAFQLLYTLDLGLLALELFIVLPYLIHGELSVQAVKDSLTLILGGPFTITFWVFFLGLGVLTPLVVEAFEVLPALLSRPARRYRTETAVATAILVLIGGFLLRYVFVFAGQESTFR